MSYTNTWNHVTEIEQNNITDKERHHAQYHRLFIIFQKLWLSVLNYLPSKGVLSPCYSPQTIVDQQPLDYRKHSTIPFGAFLQSNNDNNLTNSNVSQTIDGTYLWSLDKIQEEHEIFYLYRHRVILICKIIKLQLLRQYVNSLSK